MSQSLGKKLFFNVLVIILLVLGLIVSTLALIMVSTELEGNRMTTGYVSIDLNGGQPIYHEGDFLIEPGMTVEKEFYLTNTSPCDVWFRFYFVGLEGDLKEVLEATVFDGDTVLYSGKVTELTDGETVAPANETVLAIGETRTLKLRFHLPNTIGSDYAKSTLSFNLFAEAVQAKNNPGRIFHN